MKKNKTKSVKESWYIFSIVMLSIFLFVAIGFFLQNPFATNLPASSGLVSLGTPLNIVVENNGSNSQTLYFYGSMLPNFKVNQDVNITLKANQENAVVRAKVFMYDTQNKILPLKITTANNWQISNDGYCYCDEVLSANLSLDFVESITIPSSSANLNSSNIYSIIISVETLPQSCDYKTIWKLT